MRVKAVDLFRVFAFLVLGDVERFQPKNDFRAKQDTNKESGNARRGGAESDVAENIKKNRVVF
jgi:hypothetical protein